MADVNPMSTNSIMERAESALSDDAMAEMDVEVEPSGDSEEFEGDVELAAGDGEEEFEEDSGEGSKTQPYNVKTLPDQYVTLKVDGEEKVVSLREMTDGYMRQDAFHKRLSQVNQLKEKAEKTAERFKSEEARFKDAFTGLIRDPDNLFEFLDEHSPEVLDAVARKMLSRVIQDRNNPQAKMEREYAKRQERLEREREAFQRERDTAERTRAEQETHVKYVNEFKPGFEAGMKRAGYPQVTDEFKATVRGIVAAKREALGKVTAKDVEDAVVRAARALDLQTVQARKPAPPPTAKPSAAPPRKPKQSSSNKSFSQMWRDLGK